jgi:hypothetical protein
MIDITRSPHLLPQPTLNHVSYISRLQNRPNRPTVRLGNHRFRLQSRPVRIQNSRLYPPGVRTIRRGVHSSSSLSVPLIFNTGPITQLWMGTHPKSPSRLLTSNQTLAEHLAANPALMGQSVIQRFNASDGNLPFLFKVLAIQKALSIQTHPDKKTAEKLHAEQPDIYKGTSIVVPSRRLLTAHNQMPTTNPNSLSH